jgi:CheY-like chemotaxis protein/two-component sensor histidine kinase
MGIDTIRQSAQAQAKLIDDLLDVSRIVTGKINLNVDAADVAEIARKAAATIRTAAAAKRQRLAVEVFDAPAMVMGDAARLQQVFWNLLSNAVKFTPPGGSIEISVTKSGDSIVVRVRDSGDGIPAEFLPLVFDRFRQLGKAKQSRSGLGIGLAIAKELVEMHGGSIRAESAGEGRGSTFTVILPAARAEMAAGSSPPMRDHLRLRGVRVLLAEDDETTRTMLMTVLRTFGGEVCAASSTTAALKAAEGFAPDVIVTDIAMPGEDGIALLRRLRLERRVSAPAIAVTAYADDTSRQRVLAAGFHAFVSKPVDPADFALTVERVLRGETVFAAR